MKLSAVILTGILAYATGGSEYLDFRISSVYDTKGNEWIPIEENGNQVISEVNVLQEITGDDWMLQYSLTVNRKESPATEMKFCDTTETMQDINIMELFMKTLGLQDKGCPIQPQTITNPENSFEGYLELENYEEGQRIHVNMMLVKGDEPVLLIILTT